MKYGGVEVIKCLLDAGAIINYVDEVSVMHNLVAMCCYNHKIIKSQCVDN